jgi:hypothetical protein
MRQHMQGCTDVPQEGVVGMTRSSLLKLEKGSPIGLEVDIGSRYEVTEDAHSPHVRNGQAGVLDQGGDADRVEASRQGIRRPPPTVVTGERALSLGELAGECSGQHRSDAGGDHEADVPTIGEHSGDRAQGGRRVIDELQGAMAADKVGVGFGVDLEQVGRVSLHRDDPLGDPGVARPTVQRSQGVEAGVDDGDVMTKLGEGDGHATGATAEVDDAQASPELLLTLDHNAPHGLPHS